MTIVKVAGQLSTQMSIAPLDEGATGMLQCFIGPFYPKLGKTLYPI